jgi:hypothetical protein
MPGNFDGAAFGTLGEEFTARRFPVGAC